MFVYLILVFFFALTLSLITTRLICRARSKGKDKISYSGGIAIWSSFLIVSLLSFIHVDNHLLQLKQMAGIYICSTLIFAAGLIDDKRELSVALKFITQLLAAAIVIAFGVRTKIVGIGEFGNLTLTLLWILGITNAFNHLDIVDGLASGVAFLSTLTFFLISMITSNIAVALALLILTGSILGFFRYNFPKASIYMGNSGSHFLGFILSTLAIMISYATLESRVALIIPLLVLGFPIFDTIFVMWVRIIKNKPVWKKSNDHLPLRLISLGLSERQTIMYMFSLTAIFCICSIFILFLSNFSSVLLLSLLIILCIFISFKAKRVK